VPLPPRNASTWGKARYLDLVIIIIIIIIIIALLSSES
jgi:hypothetical protein